MLHLRIKDKVLERIRQGKYLPGDRLPTQNQMAKEFRVSSGTVSKAIHELCREGMVESRTRGGVTVLPAALTRHRGQIGFVMREVTRTPNSPFQRLLSDFSHFLAADHGVEEEIVLLPAMRGTGERRDFMPWDELLGRPFSGLLVMNVMDITWLAGLKMLSAPVVVLDRDTEEIGLDCVVFDNVAASFDMTRHLIKKGHRHVAFVGNPLPTSRIGQRNYDPATNERFQGYRMALRTHGIAYRPDYVLYRAQDSQGELEEFLKNHANITALVAEAGISSEDAGRLRAIPKKSKRRLEIAGWNWWDDRSVIRDGLAVSTAFDLSAMGKAAANLLSWRMNGERSRPQRVLLEGELRT